MKNLKKGQSRQVIRRTLAILDDLNIYTHVGFIMFSPWTTLDEVRESVEFLSDIGHLNIHTMTNFLQLSPGTPLLEPLLQDGTAFQEPHGGYGYDFADARIPVIKSIWDRVVWPLFPRWYAALIAHWELLAAEIDPAGHDCTMVLDGIDNVLYQVAQRTFAAASDEQRTDPFAVVRELNEYCSCRLDDLPELVPGAWSRRAMTCTEEIRR